MSKAIAADHIPPPPVKIFRLADKFVGFGDTAYELNDLSHLECKQLDMIAFECTTCNHWFYTRDKANPQGAQWECKECYDG